MYPSKMDNGQKLIITGTVYIPSASDMTLRDWFAGMAIMGQVSYEGMEGITTDFEKMAYEVADAMIKARSKE